MSLNIKITSIPTIVEPVTKYASYNREFQIFICKECRYYLESTTILNYFSRIHSELLSKENVLFIKDFISINLLDYSKILLYLLLINIILKI